jgi:serine/threonine protein kinase
MPEELKRGTLLGRHELLLPIGRGGMATVWVARRRADQKADERIVAVKAILRDLAGEEDFVKMFLDEGRLVARIRHPNVVELYEVGQAQGVMYMAMEWVEGDSLHTVIAEAGKRRPIPPEMAVRIVADAAAGLHAAHEATNDQGEPLGVVHRDVSPHNILIGSNGAVKLVDFGVAKAVERLAEATVAGQVKGKFGYMSPEQAVARPVDRRSDVFSLGIVLFEVTTGRRLFRGNTDAETLHLVVEGDIPRPTRVEPGYPVALERIVLKALNRSRRERFQTAEELQWALEAYLKSERTVVPRAGIGSLLKKVVGDRIEARRKAVRAALKEIAGAAAERGQLAPTGPAFETVDREQLSKGGTSGASDRSAVPSSKSSPSASGARHDLGQLTGSFTGVGQGGGSQVSSTQVSARSGTMGTGAIVGYLVGMAGLAAAAAVLVIHLMTPRTTVVKVVGSSAPGSVVAAPSAARPLPSSAGSATPSASAAASASAPAK